MGKVNILHLSDIHIGKSSRKEIDNFYSTICQDLKKKNQKIDLVVCTGDIIDGKCRNKLIAFERAVNFFQSLMERINRERLYNKRELMKTDFLFVLAITIL